LKPRVPQPADGAACLVTGASSGIGAALARSLAERGHNVVLVARREDRLHALADELTARRAIRAEPVACDLSDSDARADLARRVDALDLRVDVLVNNAGMGSFGKFAELPVEHELSQVRVMCEGVVDLCHTFVPAMVEGGSGAVLIMSSTTGFQPAARYATYAAAKAFSLSFGQSLHEELKRSGVAVTTVCPGPVRTEFFDVGSAEPVRLPRAMWSSPEEVARAALHGLERNRRLVVPGTAMRALMTSSRYSPASVQLRVMDLLLPKA
jgi:short-subunit dehydrogenase